MFKVNGNHVETLQKELSGGKIKKEQIDLLRDYQCDSISISGLRQDTFEYFISEYGNKFKDIDFFKCQRVQDLTPIEDLKEIESISFCWNQMADSFWDVSKNGRLNSLTLHTFNKINDISSLEGASALEYLSFGDYWDRKHDFQTLEPLSSIKTLKSLYFFPKRILDNRVFPLAALNQLEELFFPSNLFSTDKLAWLTARLPNCKESPILRPFRREEGWLNSESDTLINGKRKPFLDSKRHKARIDKYVTSFDDLVSHYRQNPDEGEPN